MRNKLVESACFSVVGWIDNSCGNAEERLEEVKRERNFWKWQCRVHLNRILEMSKRIEILEETLGLLEREQKCEK